MLTGRYKKLFLAGILLVSQESAYGMDPHENDELGKGGPPKTPTILGERVKIYDKDMEVKIDKEGRPFIGMPLEEIQKMESGQNTSNLVRYDESGLIYDLSDKADSIFSTYSPPVAFEKSE